jgi:DNA repair protein RAD57
MDLLFHPFLPQRGLNLTLHTDISSGTGKTQILLTLLLSAQLPEPHGLSRPTLYISTEHPLPTSRLTQLLKTHPALQAHSSPPSLSRILTLQTPDLESQEHILTYQLPVALARHKIGLCIIDSIAANYRAERPEGQISHSPSALAYRSNQLVRLGTLLRSLARAHNCAIVVANQVSDRFPPPTIRTPHLPSSNETPHAFSPLLSLDHQQRFFTGWGGHPSSPTSNLKTPSLGPVWTNQIACRIALIKKVENGQAAHPNEMALQGRSGIEKEDENKNYAKKQKSRPVVTKRWMRVVFAPWVEGAGEEDRGVEFEIWSGGVRALSNALTRSRATFGAE